MLKTIAAAALTMTSAAALAQPTPQQQRQAQTIVAIPQIPATSNVRTPEGTAVEIGAKFAGLIAADLRSSGEFYALPAEAMRAYGVPEATAPTYKDWRKRGAGALVAGFVDPKDDGRLAVACYIYNVQTGREVARKGFLIQPADWRRAAHRCADATFAAFTKRKGYFDTRVAYVAESGPETARIKRIAIMDWDGSNHAYLTPGHATVVSPHFSPDGEKLAFTNYEGRIPQVYVMDIASGETHPLVPGGITTFSPSFSPDGQRIVFSVANNGNIDIYLANVNGTGLTRLTGTPGVDSSPSFSPDGRKIVFESDRSGDQQLYVMNANGSDPHRISFGPTRYGSPAWSPDGDLIAFTSIGANLQIGVMTPDGRDMKIITNGWQDEGPSWAPSGQTILFQRTDRVTGRPKLLSVPATGGDAVPLTTPQDGSDPNWSPVRS
jgi:TolB protein